MHTTLSQTCTVIHEHKHILHCGVLYHWRSFFTWDADHHSFSAKKLQDTGTTERWNTGIHFVCKPKDPKRLNFEVSRRQNLINLPLEKKFPPTRIPVLTVKIAFPKSRFRPWKSVATRGSFFLLKLWKHCRSTLKTPTDITDRFDFLLKWGKNPEGRFLFRI